MTTPTGILIRKLYKVKYLILFIYAVSLAVVYSCNSGKENNNTAQLEDTLACAANLPSRYTIVRDSMSIIMGDSSRDGMVLIPAGEFEMGASDEEGRQDEYPQHKVKLDAFWMDATEVTNAQFKKFVDATGYISTAEIRPDWEEIKKQLPAGTAKPHDSELVASSLVFVAPTQQVGLNNPAEWWRWTKAADWKHPQGPSSNLIGKENHPVVHISWDDAMAYCKWAGKRLPTEAEWEWAARAGLKDNKYPWGNEDPEMGECKTNTWQGTFPISNSNKDAFYNSAPVRSFPSNAYGLFDMAGNVWEWCADWYRADQYQLVKNQVLVNPKGPSASYDPMEPSVPKRVVRGGSFLCNASYCKGYRVSSRMSTSPDTGLEHTGFRCVKDISKK
jgi:formylglycine-generating enzyme required for sulfatase activity